MYSESKQIAKVINEASSIVIVQADNPDADSLGSALALESILGEMGKQLFLYCAVGMPGYLRYMSGWDRIQNDLPKQFDASIIVDASTMTLLEKLTQSGQQGWLAKKPCIVLDHHKTVENPVPFSTVTINDPTRASAGELLYLIAKQLQWKVPLGAQEYLMISILGDTQGLSNSLASSETYRIIAEFIDNGVDRPALEELRREFGKMPVEIFKYKGDLIKRTEFAAGGNIATVSIPQAEINEYSPLYNPAPLIQTDMLQTAGVKLAVVFKQYADGKVTGAIRSNQGCPIAGKLAEHLGGGGHAFAAGFKITDGRNLPDIKVDCLNFASELIAKLDIKDEHEALQHAK
jgi:phosphoesterase RecJ-like protein